MGATCFMSVVLQSLLHNPIMQNYFLSDGHPTSSCTSPNCLSCELVDLFAELFTSKNSMEGFGPTKLLTTSWGAQKGLAGYAQQDAHEFLVGLINQLHDTSVTNGEGGKCHCIVHQAFCGQLLSDVTCQHCGNVTTSIDPVMDLSLELRSKRDDKICKDLGECLGRFTGQERLASYSCGICKSPTEATKQLTLRKLPPVVCLQLKVRIIRFQELIYSALSIPQSLLKLTAISIFHWSSICTRIQQ